MTDTSGLAVALAGSAPSRLLRLGIVEAVNDTAVPPTLTVNSRPMRFLSRVPIGQAALYVDEGQDPVVLGKLSEGDDGVPIGTMLDYGGSVAPPGYLPCDGRSTSGYPALAAVVGSNVPDMPGRFRVGSGPGYAVGATGGAATVVMTLAQMPQHNHGMAAHGHSMGSHGHAMAAHGHNIASHGHSWSGGSSDSGSHKHDVGQRFTGNASHTHSGAGGAASEAPNPFATGGSIGTTFSGTHAHGISGSVGTGGSGNTGGPNPSSTDATSLGNTGGPSPSSTDNNGSNQAHENRPPYYAALVIIRAA